VLDPQKRLTAAEALDSPYFWTHPLPCHPKDMPEYPASHEYEVKKRRQERVRHCVSLVPLSLSLSLSLSSASLLC
jgi:hypothetical protein